MDPEHWKLRIKGKVQGVFYRQSAMEKAAALGLNGFVMNEPDGSVYLEAEGSPEVLEELLSWCRQGPPRAKVEDVKMEKGAWKGFAGFIIKR